jgi:hypothetical protein
MGSGPFEKFQGIDVACNAAAALNLIADWMTLQTAFQPASQPAAWVDRN